MKRGFMDESGDFARLVEGGLFYEILQQSDLILSDDGLLSQVFVLEHNYEGAIFVRLERSDVDVTRSWLLSDIAELGAITAPPM